VWPAALASRMGRCNNLGKAGCTLGKEQQQTANFALVKHFFILNHVAGQMDKCKFI
jgi:hypothetical protein